ncbi:MAG: hypothetical protein ACLF0G_17805 [Candidatus Brocadiia bacterium]
MRAMASLVAVSSCLLLLVGSAGAGEGRVLGQERIVAFLYLPKGLDAKGLRSPTLVHSKPGDWQYWRERGVVPCRGKTWFDLLRSPVPKGVEILTGLDYGGDPHPVVCIDEFGFDFGGETDRKTATLLRATRGRRPELGIAVWQMRGPVSPVLAAAYREVVDLVLVEAYVEGVADYWWIATQVVAARLQGLMHKTVVGLGLGIGGRPGERWAASREELERQVRFVRLVAPESPGIAFFAAGAKRGEEGLLEHADRLCAALDEVPADGSGLPPEALELHRTLSREPERPTLVACGRWAEPNRSWTNPSKLVEPRTFRLLLLNLGREPARNVAVRLRNPEGKGGEVFARGVANVPARGVAAAVLPVVGQWEVWKTWEVELEAPGCEVLVFPRK